MFTPTARSYAAFSWSEGEQIGQVSAALEVGDPLAVLVGATGGVSLEWSSGDAGPDRGIQRVLRQDRGQVGDGCACLFRQGATMNRGVAGPGEPLDSRIDAAT